MTLETVVPDLQLLLTHAEEHLPVLDRGLPGAPLRELPPEDPPLDPPALAITGDPDDLATRRWGVVAPAGDDGDRLLDAIRPLIDHRRAQQDTAPRIDRVDAMDAAAAARWRDEFLRDPRRPRFVLLLGDLDRVTLALERALAGCAHVGRLHCPTVKGYRDYAEKLVARERAAPSPRGRALFYTVQDGTAAIEAAYAGLVEPTMVATRAWLAEHDLAGLAEIPFSDWGPDEMLALAGVDEPSVLVAAGHGIGAPRKGWRSPEQQRALQGALSMGLESPLAADTVQRAAFLPGGVWLCGASFAAASPGDSAFAPWLRRLAEGGAAGQPAQTVLRSLAGDARPFVAALPQTLLANPRGPLAVIGPADLAWADPRDDDRAGRLSAMLQALLAGRRIGVALDAVRAPRRAEPDAPPARRWLHHHDLHDYLLLGDPAARLAVQGLAHVLKDIPSELPTAEPPEPPAPLETAPSPLTAATTIPPKQTAAPSIPVEPTPIIPAPTPLTPATAPIPPTPTPMTPAAAPPAPPPRPVPKFQSPATFAPPLEATMSTSSTHPAPDPSQAQAYAPPLGAAPLAAVTRPRTLENPEIALRERAVLAMLRGDEAPRSIAVRFGLPLEEIFYWLDVYREAGRRSLAG